MSDKYKYDLGFNYHTGSGVLQKYKVRITRNSPIEQDDVFHEDPCKGLIREHARMLSDTLGSVQLTYGDAFITPVKGEEND